VNFGRRGGRREILQLDLTPMIDVVFQLVLFLVLASTFKREEVEPKPAEASSEGKASPGIQVDLPRASAQAVLADKKDVNVWISAEGKLFVDDQPVDFAGLRERLRAAAGVDPSTLVIVKADTGVAHGVVVRVMDTARTEGLTRLAIATEDPSQPSAP
jgi:biopolymer transport protein ExbD